MNDALQRLIEFVEAASPVIWAAYFKQVYVHTAVNLAWALVMGGCVPLLVRARKYCEKKYEAQDHFDSWEIGVALAWVGIVSTAFIAIGLTLSAAGRLANPEFYAIQLLLNGLGQ